MLLKSGLRNASTLVHRKPEKLNRGPKPVSDHSRRDGVPRLIPDADPGSEAFDLEKYWSEGHEWFPILSPLGFPVYFVEDEEMAEELERAYEGLPVKLRRSRTEEEVYANIFLGPQYCIKLRLYGMIGTYHISGTDVRHVRGELRQEGCDHADAYYKFVSSEIGRTEDVWGKLGADAWGDLRVLLKTVSMKDRDRNPKFNEHFEKVWKALRSKKWAEALRTMDYYFLSSGPRKREQRHKQRHYFDVVSLFKCVVSVRENEPDYAMFLSTAKALLHTALKACVSYERMYFTMFWLWGSPWWRSLSAFMLQHNIFYAPDEQYRKIMKEITATVTQTWMFPLTNWATPASLFFNNAEDLIGFSDGAAGEKEVCLEIVNYVTDNYEYTYPAGDGERTFAAWLATFREQLLQWLTPLWAKNGPRSKSWQEFMSTRSAWAPGGAGGKRATEILGDRQAPPGSSKAYIATVSQASEFRERQWGTTHIEIAKKQNERGANRTLCATDMRDQFQEGYMVHPLKNRWREIGIDIAEAPEEEFLRHITLAANSEKPLRYLKDGTLLAAWDWAQWDHFMHLNEHRIIVDVMKELISRFVPLEHRDAMLASADEVLEGHEDAILRSITFADADASKQIDAIVAEVNRREPGRMERTGKTTVRVKNMQGQQSGRFLTAIGNTLAGTTRIMVRDREIMGTGVTRKRGAAMYLLNRADDVAEIFRTWEEGRNAVLTMLRQGHRANKKKQVTSFRSIVYFRILYSMGGMRAFPARGVYAAASSGPPQGQTSGNVIVSKLKALANSLTMWARRGGILAIASALYLDARDYFRKFRVPLPANTTLKLVGEGKSRKYALEVARPLRGKAAQLASSPKKFLQTSVAVEVLECMPEHGGYGVLGPQRTGYDLSLRCGDPVWRTVSAAWREEARTLGRGLYNAPGVRELYDVASQGIIDAGVHLSSESKANVERRFKQALAQDRAASDGSGSITRALTYAENAASAKKWHRNKEATRSPGALRDMDRMQLGPIIKDIMDSSYNRPQHGGVLEAIQDLRPPPGEGVFKSLWYGMGQRVIEEAPASEREEILTKLVMSSGRSRQYMTQWRWVPRWLRDMHFAGEIGPSGPFARFVPPSLIAPIKWTISNTLHQFVFYNREELATPRKETIALLRLMLSERYTKSLLNAAPTLFLH